MGYRAGPHRLSFSRPLVMGIVNVTPDSFSDGGRHATPARAVRHAATLVDEGADLLDVGGESTRPGSAPVTEAEEIRRVVPVIERIVERFPKVPVSVDSRTPAVAAAAVAAGAAIVNDITGMGNPAMRAVAAERSLPVVIMHMKGTPATMQRRPRYKDVVGELLAFFEERIALCAADGITQPILDPGIGFGKTLAHNLELLREIPRFVALGYPVMVGASRKSFLGAILGERPVEGREAATVAVTALSVAAGASIVRVHEVGGNRDAALTAAALRPVGRLFALPRG